MSEFVFTSRPKASTVPDITFELDEREYTALAPKKIVFMQFVSAMDQKGGAGIHAILTFLDRCLEDEDRDHIEARFTDPADDLDFEDLLEVLEKLFEEWEPYFVEDLAELSGKSRAERRQAARRTPNRAAKRPARKAPAKRPQLPSGNAKSGA